MNVSLDLIISNVGNLSVDELLQLMERVTIELRHKALVTSTSIDATPYREISSVKEIIDENKALPLERTQYEHPRPPLDFPVDDYGPWPERLSLRREDLYDDDGR